MTESGKPFNRLLAALPEKEYQNLFPKLERVALVYADNIYQPGDVISHIYFPESGIISLLSAVEENSTLEVDIVGIEEMVGLPRFFRRKNIKQSSRRARCGFRIKDVGGGFSRRMQE